jgi:hypothetical protein
VSRIPKEFLKRLTQVTCDSATELRLVDYKESEKVSDVLAALFNAVEETGCAPDLWKIVQLCPIIKMNKIDTSKVLSKEEIEAVNTGCKFWREVGLVDAVRGVYEAGLCKRYMQFTASNKLHKGAVLGYLAGVDAIRAHHCRTNLMQALTSIEKPMPATCLVISWIQLQADIDSFFSRATGDMWL